MLAIEIILQLILLVIVFIIIKNAKYGIALYLAYSFLIPYCKLSLGGFVLQQNLINTVILLVVWRQIKKLDIKPFTAFFTFYGLILITIPFAHGVSSSFQLDRWRSGFMINLFVPIAIWNLHKIRNAYEAIRKFILVTIIIACVYGIFLTTAHGINPYVMFFYSISGATYNLGWFASESRLFGRISSVFPHAMHFGMFLGCAMIYIYSQKSNLNTKLLYLVQSLILVNIVTCGIRSVLFAFLITVLFFLIMCRRYKLVFEIIGIASILMVFVYLTPSLYEYFVNVSDINDQGSIGGSSLNMRIDQLEGCFYEIRDCQIFGEGLMWHEDYIVRYGAHPTIIGFESLIFIILCDHGFFGFFIYSAMIVLLLVTQRKYIKDSMYKLLLTCYMVFYFSYCILTGDYSYMKIWLIFYFITFSEMYVSQSNAPSKFKIIELLKRTK